MTTRKKDTLNAAATGLSIDNLTYEQALEELESIVSALENGEHSLEASLAFYERGQALAQHCSSLLDHAELKVRQLSKDELPQLAADISDK